MKKNIGIRELAYILLPSVCIFFPYFGVIIGTVFVLVGNQLEKKLGKIYLGISFFVLIFQITIFVLFLKFLGIGRL